MSVPDAAFPAWENFEQRKFDPDDVRDAVSGWQSLYQNTPLPHVQSIREEREVEASITWENGAEEVIKVLDTIDVYYTVKIPQPHPAKTAEPVSYARKPRKIKLCE